LLGLCFGFTSFSTASLKECSLLVILRGIFHEGGVHLESTYKSGLYVPFSSWSAMKTLTLSSPSKRAKVCSSNSVHGTFARGLGMNLRLKPSKYLRLFGGLSTVDRSWKAMFDGLLK
jgi:hypothetical protein